jgi:hypothetical protein
MSEVQNQEQLEDSLIPGFAMTHLKEPKFCAGLNVYHPIPSHRCQLTSIDSN